MVQPSPPFLVWQRFPGDVIEGVILTLVGSVTTSLGQLLPWLGNHKSGSSASLSVSFLGWLLIAVGNALHLVALKFAPASVLAPINAAGLLANEGLTLIKLRRVADLRTTAAFVLAITGVVACSTAGLRVEIPRVELLASWADPWYQIFLGSLALVVAVASWTLVRRRQSRVEMRYETFLNMPHFGQGFTGFPGNGYESIAEDSHTAQDTVVGLCLALLGGAIGSQTVCQVKEFEALLEIWSQGKPVSTGILLSSGFGFAIPAVAQYALLMPAYSEVSPRLVSTTYYVSWTVFAAAGGLIKFQEYRGLDTFHLSLLMGGMGLCVSSVGLLCWADRGPAKDVPIKEPNFCRSLISRYRNDWSRSWHETELSQNSSYF